MGNSFLEDYGPDIFKGFDLTNLAIDEAYVHFPASTDANLTVYDKLTDCHWCPYGHAFDLAQGENKTIKFSTNRKMSFLIKNSISSIAEKFIWNASDSQNNSCLLEGVELGEFGIYEIKIGTETCHLETIKEPVFIYGALIIAILVYLAIFIGWKCFKFLNKKCKKIQKKSCEIVLEGIEVSNDAYPGNVSSTKKRRVKALDTFRGITIALMIFVNYGGGGYWFFSHAPWDGLWVADVVFPWFIWIMGVCIPIGRKSQIKKNIPKGKAFVRIFKRSLKLFALGLILNTVGGHNQLENLRIPGVLQRFAISYFVTSTVYLLCGPSSLENNSFKKMKDVIVLFPQWILYTVLLFGYLIFIFFMPVEGCPRGYFGPGGTTLFQDGVPSPDCIGGATRMVDVWVLGESHIYQRPTAFYIFNSSAFDPEGILGSIPTIFQVFLGIQAGQTLLTYEKPTSRIYRWLLWSLLTFLGGFLLSGGVFIGGLIPVNKNLWSLSFLLITSSTAFLLLTVCFVLVDYKKFWSGGPFFQAGMNSIFLYVAHFFTYNVFPWRFKYGLMNTHMARLSEALFGTTLWILVALYLHKKKKFYTV